jgi:two-component system sensor histidine kinase BaeS
VAFYVFYNSYIRLYLSDKIDSRQSVTIEYINNIIERQTLEDIDGIFSDVELEFFELLDLSDGNIGLAKDENVNVVVDYLVKSWVWAKYIEEIIPENNLEKVLELLKDKESPEKKFVTRLFFSLILTNIIALLILAIWVLYFTKKIILPIKRATWQIKSLNFWKDSKKIDYAKKDEIGLLIESINGLNSRLSIQEKIRSRLLADISHELKTPITSIQCYLEWISDGVIELSDQNLASITGEMTRLTDLVNQIMEYEKFENSDIELKKQQYNPYRLISSIAETQALTLDVTKQAIEITGSQNIEIYLDRDLFTQLTYNLIWNFKKYSGSSTVLNIDISSGKIVFSDNGQWIAKKEIPFLFEKFYQGKKEKTWNISLRWIGVGLSIVKKIVSAHGWKGIVKSDTGKWFSYSIVFK